MQVESYVAAQQRQDLRLVAEHVMEVREVKHVPPEERGMIRLTGELLQSPEAAYAYLSPRLHDLGYTALLQEDRDNAGGAALLAVPGMAINRQSRLWLALLLFLLTVASTMFVGGNGLVLLFTWLAGQPVSLADYDLGLGLAFSASIMSILLAHELGHFLMARRLGVAVSYPFFIPVPFTFIGTMGAVIAMKEPPPDRRALLAIAISGPVAGLIVAVPILLFGLSISEVQSFAEIAEETPVIFMEGNSLLYAAAKIAVFGRFLPDGTSDVLLHPVALAGWVGLLVTALNLIPAGQLDGGHILYALVGERVASIVTRVLVVVLLALGFLWVGWFLWALLLLFLGQYRAPILNELVPLTARERMIAVMGLVLFALVFMPVPFSQVVLNGG